MFVGSRIAHPSESYFSRKVMSEVSVSRRRRSPSAVGLAAYVYSYSSVGFCYRYSREGLKNRFDRRVFEREDLFGPQSHLSERELLIAEGDE